MKARALENYHIPEYPSKKQVREQPQLLKRIVCTRWQKLLDAGLSGALIAGISLTGCENNTSQNPNIDNGSQVVAVQNTDGSQNTKSRTVKVAAIIAPIFEHGEGRGSFGCMALAPPPYLSEDEALVIIKEELAKNGIFINKKKVILEDVKIQPGHLQEKSTLNPKTIEAKPLEIDLRDSKKGISVEFVSIGDYIPLGGRPGEWSIQEYDTKTVAKNLGNQLKANTKDGIYGVFYDPMVKANLQADKDKNPSIEKIKATNKDAKISSKNLLRRQVQDFAEWLKKEKVI
jgi:hypothetical protein